MTAKTKLPKDIANASYTGAWAVDIEADGDLDIVLGAKDGVPTRPAKQRRRHLHAHSSLSRMFPACADLPGPILTATAIPTPRSSTARGVCTSFMNERQGQFRERLLASRISLPSKRSRWRDPDNDGVLDLLAVQADGAIIRISDKNEGKSVGHVRRSRVFRTLPAIFAGEVRLHVADLDNNGALDLLLSPRSAGPGAQHAAPSDLARDENGRFVLLEHVGDASGRV